MLIVTLLSFILTFIIKLYVLSVIMISFVILYVFTLKHVESHNAECCYTEHRYAECLMLIVAVPSY
jgi:hypothetical protein